MTRTDFFHAFVALLAGLGMGLIAMTLTQPMDINLPVQPAPTPAVAPVDRDLVVGLSELLVDVHKEAEETKQELAAVKAEALQIIQAMIAEINKLQSRPTLNSKNVLADPESPESF